MTQAMILFNSALAVVVTALIAAACAGVARMLMREERRAEVRFLPAARDGAVEHAELRGAA